MKLLRGFQRRPNSYLPSSGAWVQNPISLWRVFLRPLKLNTFSIVNWKMKYLKPMKLYRDLLKSNELKRGRLLGLDVGDKYVGLSVSDPNNKIASPLSVLMRKKTNIELMATDFQSLVSELSLEGFVIGYPFDRHKSSPDAVQVKLFIDDLSKTGKLKDLKYTFWDECFTSKNVEFLLKPLKLHPVQFKTIMDKFAAVGILQAYLDFAHRSEGQIQESQIFQNEND
ncbi:hypothetical protein BUALT_Bualt10G0047700 [Buddleja alternifolia]|uniref:YqgF/RNase H-like domain-containing protein n=1 Tax=Buddleja alternifolia TaxID=168488 RepID=A0AAV6WW42_9LAMI|nr:hypothetical protein BUALT_Bualt10G0047700 [Buddleja alternifolia]